MPTVWTYQEFFNWKRQINWVWLKYFPCCCCDIFVSVSVIWWHVTYHNQHVFQSLNGLLIGLFPWHKWGQDYTEETGCVSVVFKDQQIRSKCCVSILKTLCILWGSLLLQNIYEPSSLTQALKESLSRLFRLEELILCRRRASVCKKPVVSCILTLQPVRVAGRRPQRPGSGAWSGLGSGDWPNTPRSH